MDCVCMYMQGHGVLAIGSLKQEAQAIRRWPWCSFWQINQRTGEAGSRGGQQLGSRCSST